MPVLGYFLTDVVGYSIARVLYVLTPVALIQLVSRWRGSATNQLILTLAKRVEEAKGDG